MDFSITEITSKKVRGNNVHFSNIEITSKKVRRIHVDFSTSEITSKKVSGIHVDFWTIEITSKKYAETTWKFVEIWSSTYQRNIHVESTWIRRGVPVGYKLLWSSKGGVAESSGKMRGYRIVSWLYVICGYNCCFTVAAHGQPSKRNYKNTEIVLRANVPASKITL